MKDIIVVIAFTAALIFLTVWGLPKLTGREMIGHHGLRDDHIRIKEMQKKISLGMAAAYADTKHDLQAIDKKLDLLLNMATNRALDVEIVQ